MAKNRATIYDTYCLLPGQFDGLPSRSKAFCKELTNPPLTCNKGGRDIKRLCDIELAMLNEIGLEANRKLLGRSKFIKLGPQGVVRIAVILQDYLAEGKAVSGKWYAEHAIRLAHRSVKLLIKHKQVIKIPSKDGVHIPIEIGDLEILREKLGKLL